MQYKCTILSAVSCLATLHVTTLSYRGHKNTENNSTFLFFLQILSVIFLSLSRTERNVIRIVYWCLCGVGYCCVSVMGLGLCCGTVMGLELWCVSVMGLELCCVSVMGLEFVCECDGTGLVV
jgi:hypothetical protein